MKILFITHYDNLYGANNALLSLVAKLQIEGGHKPIMVVPLEGTLTKVLDSMGVEYIVNSVTQWQAPYSLPVLFDIKKAKRKKAFLKEIDDIYNALKEKGHLDIDIIHSNSSVIGTGAFLRRRLDCKHVWHIREFSREHFNMRYFFGNKLVKELYEEADYLVAISDAIKDNYISRYPKANIIRIYDGIEVKEYERFEDGHKAIRFVYAGYLFPMKRQLSVIRSCGELKRSGIKEFEMIFLGDGKAEYKARLKKEITKQGLEKQVRLCGYVEDVHKVLSTCDVGVIASVYEGFGLVTVEYMMHSLPVIGYRHSGTAEIIDDMNTGILYDSDSELSKAMRQLTLSKDTRLKMGQNGFIRAKNMFNSNNNVISVLKLYDMLYG